MSASKGSGSKGPGKKAAPVQSNSMFSYFKKEPSAGGAAAPAAAAPPRAASTAAPATAPRTPPKPTSSASAASTLTPEQQVKIEANRAAAAAKLAAAGKAIPMASQSPAARVAAAAASGASNDQLAASYFGAELTPATASPARQAPAKPAISTPPRAQAAAPSAAAASPTFDLSSSGRKRKTVAYGEGASSGDDDDEGGARARASASKAKGSASKRRRGGQSDDDEEFTGGAAASSDDDGEADDAASEDEFDDGEERKTPLKAKAAAKRAPASASSFGSGGKKAPAKKQAAAAAADDDDGDNEAAARGGKDYSTPFLDEGNRRDINRRRPGDKGYDPTTLYIPPECWEKFTPAERQYWEHKQVNCDLTLFFKVGKFYEMYDEDAAVGVRELGLSYMMNQKRPHCGFPEAALHKYAERLVNLGYKIGQVDQTETPEMMRAANALLPRGAKKQQCVRRELSEVMTPGTIVESEVLNSADANYLLALVERELTPDELEAERAMQDAKLARAAAGSSPITKQEEEEANMFVVELGFCYVDCTTGKFVLGQRRDDKQRSFLKTLLGQVSPKEIITPRDTLSRDTLHVLRLELQVGVIKNEITPGKEFWSAEQTMTEINKKKYFEARRVPSADSGTNPYAHWPPALQQAHANHQTLALSSLGAVVFYLRRTLHDQELISQSHFTSYADAVDLKTKLVLDGQTLSNLEIVKNQEGGLKGTLLEFTDRCSSAIGKRKLRTWVTAPLYNISAITERQDAVAFWMQNPEVASDLRALLKKLPDLERFLSRIHAYGQKRNMNVIMYEESFSIKKLELFMKTLEGFDIVLRVIEALKRAVEQDQQAAGTRLCALVTPQKEGGLLPSLEGPLNAIRTKFDIKAAKMQKKVITHPGVDAVYDETCQRVVEVHAECDAYLKQIRAQFGDSSIKFVHKGKERYQIEIPIKTLASKKLPRGFDLKTSTKTVKRFWTETSQELSAAAQQAEDKKEEMEKDAARSLFACFAQQYPLWIAAVELMSELDCLLSLALASAHHSGCVRPEFITPESNGGRAMLELRNSVSPTLYEQTHVSALRPDKNSTFIANDIFMGVPEENPARFVLVTGPNMGGKSTLLRQTCCAVILAQVGCWIPAESCRMTPVDRIFTRVGANDKIMQGKSTFLVELQETSVILKNATNRSLVILDELGRGTSTFDGTAIAHAVIKYLSENVDCISLFATHYHMLIDEFKQDPRIAMYHMACHVDPQAEDVTFLYKFIRGVAHKSYGGNVAQAAGLPPPLVQRAKEMSESFEKRCVEAMGHTRNQITAAFPAQKPGAPLALPASTVAAMQAARAAKDWPAFIKLRDAFKRAQSMHAKTEQGDAMQV